MLATIRFAFVGSSRVPTGTALGVVTSSSRLVFSWSAGGPVVDTRVSFRLEPDGEGTRFLFEHSGFAGLKLVLISFVMGMGYRRSVLPRLARLLADG